MRWLRHDVIRDNKKICVISDRHLGIRAVFRSDRYGWSEANGEAVHRLCAQHVAENMLKNCRNEMACLKFKKACRKNSPWNFKKYLQEVENWDPSSRKYLDSVGKQDETNENEIWAPQTWSLCHDKGNRWGIMTSNGSESLHMVFREARGLPICALVIATYYKLLAWFNQRKVLARELFNHHQVFSNRISHILERRLEKAMRHEVILVDIDEGVYQVIAKNECDTSRGR